jgi:hypothetical protein
MKKFLIIFALTLPTVVAAFGFAPQALAANVNYNNLIDDQVFDAQTMTATQIDAFLNGFPNSCISSSKGFRSPDPTGYNSSQGFTYGSKVTAGKVIYDAAHAYSLNPQVLLATLQKEQSLVTGSAGCHPNTPNPAATVRTSNSCTTGTATNTLCTNACPYAGGCVNIALGYGCPYYCYASKEGFSKQIVYAAWFLSFVRHRAEGQVNWAPNHGNWDNTDDLSTNYTGPMAKGTYQRCSSCSANYYSGVDSLGDGTVTIQNGATAALYYYTPFKSGNTNFVNIFTSWFGSVAGPFYKFSSAINPPATMLYGQVSTAELKLVNNSSQTWYADGHLPAGVHPFRLMMRGYKNTAFANASDPVWLGTKNQVAMKEASVAPGQTATFDFTLRAPSYATHEELNMVLVQDGVKVYQDLGLQFRITSMPDYAYQVVSIRSPHSMLPGDAYNLTIKLKNTGANSWYSDDNRSAAPGNHPIRLATGGYKNSPFAYPATDPAWLGVRNQIKLVEPTVTPGSTGTFTATVVAPYKSISKYAQNFALVLDGVKFIPGPSIPSTISIPPLIAKYSVISKTGAPTTMHAGQSSTFSITLRNTGNLIWRNIDRRIPGSDSGQEPLRDVRMMTWAPGYRDSKFASSTSEWMGTKNQISAVTPVVSPGKNASYTITFTAPTTPGKYTEKFNLVLDGLVVMPYANLSLPITVIP